MGLDTWLRGKISRETDRAKLVYADYVVLAHPSNCANHKPLSCPTAAFGVAAHSSARGRRRRALAFRSFSLFGPRMPYIRPTIRRQRFGVETFCQMSRPESRSLSLKSEFQSKLHEVRAEKDLE